MVLDNELALCHHGIGGQKWGQQNGPPYPLDPNKDYSKKELRALRKQARKEERKENRRRKKLIKRYEKEEAKRREEEEEEQRIEEAKKKAIASGSASEIEKYRSKMTLEELAEASMRIKAFQDLDRLKLSEFKLSSDKIREECNKITAENDLKKQELLKAYGPGKGEAMLDKAARISGHIGTMATNAGKLVELARGNVALEDKKFALNKKKKEYEESQNKAKKEKLINKIINSGDENEINKHLNDMNNEQLKSAFERLEMLNPDKENEKRRESDRAKRVDKIIRSGDTDLINKHLHEMTNDEVKAALDRIDILYPNNSDPNYDVKAQMKYDDMSRRLDALIKQYHTP